MICKLVIIGVIACATVARADVGAPAAGPTPTPANWFRNANLGWETQFDFDGDGRPDRVSSLFSGGAHCCYRIAITLSTTGRTEHFPFLLDGGYTAGLDFSKPDHFLVSAAEAGRAKLQLEIGTYGYRRDPLPQKWRRRYGIKSHHIRISYRAARWVIEDDPAFAKRP